MTEVLQDVLATYNPDPEKLEQAVSTFSI